MRKSISNHTGLFIYFSTLLCLLTGPSAFAFRLSRLLTLEKYDVAPKAFARWEEKTITIGTRLETNVNYPTASTQCPNITSQKDKILAVIDLINSIDEANITLKWGGSEGGYDITIYSYSAAEWATYTSFAELPSNVLGRAEVTAICKTQTECNMTTTGIRMNCAKLGEPPSESTVDFRSVLLHEVIHTLGLDHSEEEKAVMYPLVSANSTLKRSLTGDDESGIIFLYPKSSPANVLKYLVCGRIGSPQGPQWKSHLLNFGFPLLIFLFIIFLKARSQRCQKYKL